ncbi:MAG: tetratricopeptide repeat protein [Terriglobales bacterium]
MYRLADLELAEGDVADALRHAQQAIDSFRPIQGGYQYLTAAMCELGEILEAEGNLEGARQQFQAALDIQEKLGEMDLVAQSRTELAKLALQQGHAEQAESLLRLSIAEFEKEKSDPSLTDAYTLLSRALLVLGKFEDARDAAKHATQVSLSSFDPALKLSTPIQSARVALAAVGKHAPTESVAAARHELRSVLATAHELGYYLIECETRLALGELEMKVAPASGRVHLGTLSAETRSRGLELLALQAEQAANITAAIAVAKK